MNNHISTIFQILKPIDLHGCCQLAETLENEFWRSNNNRIKYQIEEDRKDRKANQISEADKLTLIESGLVDDDSDDEIIEQVLVRRQNGMMGNNPFL